MTSIILRIFMLNIQVIRPYLISKGMCLKVAYPQEQRLSLCVNGLTYTYLSWKKTGN